MLVVMADTEQLPSAAVGWIVVVVVIAVVNQSTRADSLGKLAAAAARPGIYILSDFNDIQPPAAHGCVFASATTRSSLSILSGVDLFTPNPLFFLVGA